MALSTDLISQFVKVTNDNKKTSKETTVKGTVVENGKFVILDGSTAMTPVATTSGVKSGDRVTVLVKDHTATITGNLSSPSSRVADVDDVNNKISEFEILLAYEVSADELAAIRASIDNLRVISAKITSLESVFALITSIEAKYANMKYVSADEVEVISADIESLKAMFAKIVNVSAEDLYAANAELDNLNAYNAEFTYISAKRLKAMYGDIKELDAEKLSAEDADLRYVNIDFTNIDQAWMSEFYSKSGIIENVTIGEGTITGRLVGVTITGDLIETNTLVADKLVIKGEDGLYYKLNTDGVTTESEQTEYNSLSGSVITAKSITATKISVSDLVAFDATIGGFNITNNSLYSGVKETIDNTTPGIFLGNDGQVSFGDGTNYLRYYRDENGVFKLEISAESILFGAEGRSSMDDIKALTEHVKIGTWEDPETGELNPSVELSEGDSDFKQVITNKAARIMEGHTTITEMNVDGVETENITAHGEIRQGGWVWVTHGQGNLGLMWKGATN